MIRIYYDIYNLVLHSSKKLVLQYMNFSLRASSSLRKIALLVRLQIANLSSERFTQSNDYNRNQEISFGFVNFFFVWRNMRSYLGTLFKAVIHKINIKPKECNQIITLKVSIRLYRLWQKHSFINIGGWTICLYRIAFCRNLNKP